MSLDYQFNDLSTCLTHYPIPVMWRVKEHPSSAVAHEDYAVLLDEAAKVLPSDIEVLFLADRGFADTALMKHLKRLQWHYRIRIKANFSLYLGKHRRQVSDYHLGAGQAVFLHHVRLTKALYGRFAYGTGAPSRE